MVCANSHQAVPLGYDFQHCTGLAYHFRAVVDRTLGEGKDGVSLVVFEDIGHFTRCEGAGWKANDFAVLRVLQNFRQDQKVKE